jgi:hypothetical protein
VFTHLRAAQEFQAQVAQYGVRVGLEQFGVGLNSFQLLTHFNAALLKIDRSFMEDLSGNPDHQARVREIAEKARELGKTTIAEFVQDAGSMSMLFGAGIDYAQGDGLRVLRFDPRKRVAGKSPPSGGLFSFQRRDGDQPTTVPRTCSIGALRSAWMRSSSGGWVISRRRRPWPTAPLMPNACTVLGSVLSP